MEIRFWGVRGSVAASGAQVSRIGGNTSCVEVVHEGHRLIFDAGTGIRALGDALLREPGRCRATLLFSHLHWDHVQGFPFFTPAYVPTSELCLVGPGASGAADLERALSRQMQPPSFPVTSGRDAGEALVRGRGALAAVLGRAVRDHPVRGAPPRRLHRLPRRGRTARRSSTRPTSSSPPAQLTVPLASALAGADALCLDAQYTPDEYEGRGTVCKRGWGHSTMIDAAKIAPRGRREAAVPLPPRPVAQRRAGRGDGRGGAAALPPLRARARGQADRARRGRAPGERVDLDGLRWRRPPCAARPPTGRR